MIVQNNIKHINTIGLAAAKAAANPIVCRSFILFLYMGLGFMDILWRVNVVFLKVSTRFNSLHKMTLEPTFGNF